MMVHTSPKTVADMKLVLAPLAMLQIVPSSATAYSISVKV